MVTWLAIKDQPRIQVPSEAEAEQQSNVRSPVKNAHPKNH